MEYQLEVSKVDAGIAILQTDDYNVIEFPSLLLPDSVSAGSIVNIKVTRNEAAESERLMNFKQLQKDIMELYGNAPSIPAIKCENRWLDSFLLSFDFDERGSEIQEVSVLVNGSTVSSVWKGRQIKVSNVTSEYPLQVSIQISTSAGLFESNPITIEKNDVLFGGFRIAIVGFPDVTGGESTEENVPEHQHTYSRLSSAITRMKASVHDVIQFDSTHAVISKYSTDTSKTAQELHVPLVSPEWLYACLDLQKVVDISEYPLESTESIDSSTFVLLSRRFTSQWLNRHRKDPYVRRSSVENYRARSAYKLMQIDDKYSIIHPGMTILELGSSPGGWTQVCTDRLYAFGDEDGGAIIAVDLDFMEPLDGVKFIMGDFMKPFTQEKIRNELDGSGKVDLILSDMLPNRSGNGIRDNEASIILCQRVLNFTYKHLHRGGSILMKILQCGHEISMRKNLEKRFEQALIVKPSASRKESREIYLLAKGFTGGYRT